MYVCVSTIIVLLTRLSFRHVCRNGHRRLRERNEPTSVRKTYVVVGECEMVVYDYSENRYRASSILSRSYGFSTYFAAALTPLSPQAESALAHVLPRFLCEPIVSRLFHPSDGVRHCKLWNPNFSPLSLAA